MPRRCRRLSRRRAEAILRHHHRWQGRRLEWERSTDALPGTWSGLLLGRVVQRLVGGLGAGGLGDTGGCPAQARPDDLGQHPLRGPLIPRVLVGPGLGSDGAVPLCRTRTPRYHLVPAGRSALRRPHLRQRSAEGVAAPYSAGAAGEASRFSLGIRLACLERFRNRLSAVGVGETADALVAEGTSALSEGTPESNERAVALFERALDTEPRFGPAYVGLAKAFLERADELRLGDQWFDQAVAAGEKAVELDPSSIEGCLTLSFAYRAKGYLRKELDLWQRRAQLVPDDTTARIRAGWVLWFTGRPDEALPMLQTAAAQRPEDRWVHFFLGNTNLALGDYDEAERMYRKTLEHYPNHSSAHAGVIWSLLAAGNDEEARSRLRLFQASELDGDRYFVKVADLEYLLGEDESALLHARRGVAAEPEERYWPRGFLASTILGALQWPADRAGAEDRLQRSEQIDRRRLEGGDEGFMPHIDVAAVEAIRGEARNACGSLRAAMAAGWRYGSLAARDRLFENLRDDREFQALVVT
jgi:tetratricopeptide (TPR) repeat protein